MRVNPKLVYPHGKLFVRRSPEDVTKWQVVDGHFITENGKRTGFECTRVLIDGLAKGGTMEGGARRAATELEASMAAQTAAAAAG